MRNNQFKIRKLKVFHHSSELGSAPGTLVAHPDLARQPTTLRVTAYNEDDLVESVIQNPDEIGEYLKKYTVTWLNVSGLGDIDCLQHVAKLFNFHALAMEDVVNVHQRPKVEEYNNVIFAVTRMPDISNDVLNLDQVSIFWGENFVVTFQLQDRDCLDPLRNRIKRGGKRQRLLKAEYLAYGIMDTIVDSFFPIVETYGIRLDDIEEEAINNPCTQIIVNIHDFKHDIMLLRRAMWSQREAIRTFSEIGKFANSDMRFFIRDCEDHTVQLIDILESYRERMSGLMDIYLSSVNNKLNHVMKFLTMIATIFMPAGVVASIYGMNFDRNISPWNMPELSWRYGYEFALGLMLMIAIIMLFTFWKHGWFKRDL